MSTVHSPELDALLEKKISVLDDGYVIPIDYMGDDSSIVRAARVSYGVGTKRFREDRALIRFLMRHRHTTPFEMCTIMFHLRIPMDCWRQMVRHRTASINEYSTRYSVAIDSMAKTDPAEWRSQSKTNKQGSAEPITAWPGPVAPAAVSLPDVKVGADGYLQPPGEYLTAREAQLHALALEVYEERLAFDVAKEQARKDLPLSNYTEVYWKMDLHNLFHFLGLRMDAHAQLEIRSYANAIAEIVKVWVPDAWSAFEDYRLNAMHLTALDIRMLRGMRLLDPKQIDEAAEELGWKGEKNRERDEFSAKAARLGIVWPSKSRGA